MRILIAGAAGRLAGIVAERLASDGELIGLDVRAQRRGRDFPGPYHRIKRYNHRSVAEVFRHHRPRMLLHLGMRAATASVHSPTRYTQNVLGTRKLLQLCKRYDVERVVVLGTYHVYGAHEHNPVNIREDAPLRGGQIYKELVDVVELDHTVTNFLWQHREVSTVLLRAANIVGPRLNNSFSRLLRSRPCPRLLGFNPLLQFLHEEDAARAIVVALRGHRWGAYNVAGEGAIPYSHAIRLAGGRPMTIPHVIAPMVVAAVPRWRRVFPRHLLDYFRYSVLIDDRAFRSHFEYEPQFTTVQTLQSVGGPP
jgi:UDP-glucose 4-epimerase